MKIRFVRKSRKTKTGPIAVTTTEEKSCPPSCSLKFVVVDGAKKLGPCYANFGPTAQRWREINDFQDNWTYVMGQIAALPNNDLWRHNQAGDLPGDGELIDKPKLRQLVKANRGKRGFTYSHKHSYAKQRAQIRWANDNGFTVNLSADNLDHAYKLSSYEVGPVCVTLPHDFDGTKQTRHKADPFVFVPLSIWTQTARTASCAKNKAEKSSLGSLVTDPPSVGLGYRR